MERAATDKLRVISLSVDQLTAFATKPYRSSVPFVPKEYWFSRLRMVDHFPECAIGIMPFSLTEIIDIEVKYRRRPQDDLP
jgi:hypothetical protein